MEDTDQQTFSSGTSQRESGSETVPLNDADPNTVQQPGNPQRIQSNERRRFCSICTFKRKVTLAILTITIFLTILIVVLIHKSKHNEVEFSQAGHVDAQTDADKVKCIPGLCLKEDASCKEPHCHVTYTNIPALESLHHNQTNGGCPIDKEGCKLVRCSDHTKCLECHQIKEQVVNNTNQCDDTLNCCHALTLMNECSNRSKTNHITSFFCVNDNSREMPKQQCIPGWAGDLCDQPRSRNITCKCYDRGSDCFCRNYTNCSEMTYVENMSSLCRNKDWTQCLDKSHFCRSQSGKGDQCLCSVKDLVFGDKDWCWKTDAQSKEYCNNAKCAFTVPALERLHKIDQSIPCWEGKNDQFENDLVECNDYHTVDDYDMAEMLLHKKLCEIAIKCCHVMFYGQKFFNLSGNGNHQIASLSCEDDNSNTPPVFQCKQGWRGERCNERNEKKIDCRCFKSYDLCETITDCSKMMYLNASNTLCSKHNLTHCELQSLRCRTNIEGKECVCNVDT